MTWADVIYQACRKAGVLRLAGRGAGTDYMSEALHIMNAMFDSWALERLLVYTISRDVYPFVAGQQTYTLAPDGDWVNPRPVKIEGAAVIINTNPAQPVEMPVEVVDYARWMAVRSKSQTTTYPNILYSDNAFPRTNLSWWPTPTQVNDAVLYTWQVLSAVASTADVASLPPGYLAAIEYNLALELAPQFEEVRITPTMVRLASHYKGIIKRANLPENRMMVDAGCGNTYQGGAWDIHTRSWHP